MDECKDPGTQVLSRGKAYLGSGSSVLHQRPDQDKSDGSSARGVKVLQLVIDSNGQGNGRGANKLENLVKKEDNVDVCTICGSTFTQKTAFNAHIKLHLKEKLAKRAKQTLATRNSLKHEEGNSELEIRQSDLSCAKRKLDLEMEQKSKFRIKVEPPCQQEQPSQSVLTKSNCLSAQTESHDNFLRNEFSKEMGITKDDLNKDLCSILDQIEKDFDGQNLNLGDVTVDSPPDSDAEPTAVDYLSSLLCEQEQPPSAKQEFPVMCTSYTLPSGKSVSLPLLNHKSTEPSLTPISFEKLLDINSLQVMDNMAEPTQDQTAADHDYLPTLPRSTHTPLTLSPQSSTTINQSTTFMTQPVKLNSQQSAKSLSLFSQSPGRIFVQRSVTDNKIINVFRLGGSKNDGNFPVRMKVSSPDPHEPLEESSSTSQSSIELELEAEESGSDTFSGRFLPPKSKQSADCSVCGKSITTKNMARHMEKHTGKKKFQCGICRTSFFQKTHLKNHILLHETGEYHECEECSQKFLRKTDYLKHIKSVHGIEATISCNICGAQFAEISKMEVHRQLHTIERKELCGLCGEKFDTKTAMITHMQLHTSSTASAKSYTCSVCKKTFSQKSHLNRHIKSHGAAGDQDLVCAVCKKQCKNRVELVRHRANHIACTVCNRLFDTRPELQQHMLNVHSCPSETGASCFMSPGSLSSGDVDFDFLDEDEDDCHTPLSRSPVDIFNSGLDISPCPSSVGSSSSSGDLSELQSGFPTLFSSFDMEDSGLDAGTGKNQTLSLDDISDSSFFDINHHLDEEILSTDLFAN